MSKKWKMFLTLISSALILLLAIFLIWYLAWLNNKPKYLPNNTYLGTTDISGYSQSELEQLIINKERDLRDGGLKFKNIDDEHIFPLNFAALSPDIPGADLQYADSISIDIKSTVNNLFDSPNHTFTNYVVNKIFNKKNYVTISYQYNLDTINVWLENNFSHLIVYPEQAYFSWEIINNERVLINHQEKIGKEINQEELIKDLNGILSTLDNQDIVVKTKSKYPLVTKEDLEPLRDSIKDLIPESGLVINYASLDAKNSEQETINVDKEVITTWLSVDSLSGNLSVSFNLEKIKKFLEEEVSPQVNKEVVLPKFEIINNKVSSWQSGKNGQSINIESSANIIKSGLLNRDSSVTIEIAVVNVDDLDIEADFKIKELIGTGHSSFAGSPANRRHNIKVGADSLNGLLIKPGEEFSLIKYLGDIDASTGYLPELVIKDGKTIPEYGGGLCQVATTIFRSALGSGLPITARRNHSYRVSYYEPAGTDAAIYDPWPDVKFINDTNNYILIQSKIDGNNLSFDFWGTSDGRIASTTSPVVYNIVKPPATKFIETDELKPGEKKCTEKAHNGADAYFDYKVIYPEGATTTPIKEVRFSSHYVPWQEVCLVGKEVINEIDNEQINNDVIETTEDTGLEQPQINPEIIVTSPEI